MGHHVATTSSDGPASSSLPQISSGGIGSSIRRRDCG